MTAWNEIAIEYEIDAEDNFVSIGGDWDEFAEKNGAPGLSADYLLGRSLWGYISGVDTTSLYRVLIERVRESKRAVNFDFRCDSPDRRRWFHLIVTPLPGNCLRFYSILLKEEERQPVSVFDAEAARNEEVLTVCSVCKKVNNADTWMEVEDAVKKLGLMNREPHPQISHGLCSECYTRLLEGLDCMT
ncbi:MAG: hypothetical protein IT364_26570 [Candidatus Hydrogenedentes bacterium]|nr:hypothetical protein [Candidatus Hydrogenedentota bacterium]